MLEFLKRHFKNEKGLSLVELLAVIVILGIVAAIAVPAIGNIINNQRDKAVLADISGLVSSAKIAFADGSCGVNNICEYTEIDFASEKLSGGEVSFAGTGESADPGIKVTLKAGVAFKGKNATTLTTLVAKKPFKESELNAALEGR